MKDLFQSKPVPRGPRTIWRYLSALILLFSLSINQMWAAEETITWDGTSLAGVSSTNITAGTASAVQGSDGRKVQTIEVYENNSVKYIASGGTTRKKYNDGWWENFYNPACTTSDCTDASTTARIEIPFTIGDSKTFDVTGVSFSFTQNGGSGPAVHAFLVQGTTEVWLGYILGTGDVSYSPVSPATKLTTLEAGAAKLVFVLGIGANKLKDNRGFLFSNISITGNIENAGGGETIDTEAPTLSSSVPANNATNVAVEGTIVLTFSEAIASVDGTKFTLTGATKGTVAINSTNSKQVNVPYSGAANEAIVTLSVAAEAVADAAGNKSAALSNISFTTVAAAPTPAEKDGVKMVENGALTGNFVTSATLTVLSGDAKYTIDGIDYTKYLKFNGTFSGSYSSGARNNYLIYDLKKQNTTFHFYVRNNNGTAFKIVIYKYAEGGSSTKATEIDVAANEVARKEFSINDVTANTRVFIGVNTNNSNAYICQVVAEESGALLKQGGEIGYSVQFNGSNKSRFTAASGVAISMDGIEYVTSSGFTPNSSTEVALGALGTNYVKFTLPVRTKVKVTTNSTNQYYIGSTYAADAETSKTYGFKPASANTEHGFNLNAGTYYLNPNASNIKLTKLVFAEPDVAYAVTYSAGEGSVKEGKSLPTQADAVAGEKFNLASGDNLERSGYDFSGWKANGTGDLLLAGSEYTMGNAAVQFVAQWQLHVAKYGVKFMDGEEKLDSLSVTLGQAPSFADPKKALHTFTGWRDGGDNDVTLSDLATSVTVEDTKLVLYAKWAKAYAADGTVNFADDDNSGALADFLPAGYACGNLDGSKNSVWGKESEGDAYFGYKLRHSGAYVELRVVANKRVTFTFGNYAQAGTIKVGEAAAETCTLTDSKYVVDTDAEAVIRFTTTSDGTVTLKSIIIGEIPAQSDDASLSDLTLKYGTDEAATISGFASTKQIYYVEAPYGTAKADLPIVGATATDATNALVTINQAKDREDWKTVIRVQAEDRIEAHDMYYEVRFKVQPKLGVEIIKAVTTTANDGDATGYIGGTYKNTKTGNAVKLDKNNHFGLVIAANNAFQEGDIFAMNITVAAGGNMGTMKIYESTDATEPLFESTEIGTVGMNYWTLPASVNGKTSLYIKRGGGDDWNPTFSSIAVYRLMAPFIESFEIEGIDNFEIDQVNKTITASVANSFDVTALEPTVKYWGNGGGAINKTGAQNFTNPVTYTVSSAYAEDATGDYAPVIYTVTINKVAPSVEPTITTQPQGANYVEGATIAALTVVAESAEGELSYQWQVKNGNNYEDIEGANAVSYAPAISAIGSYTYRVVVTNTEDNKPATSVNSEEATIEITSDPACATFVEASIPTAEPYQYTNTGEWTIYNASSSGKRNGSDQVFPNVKDFEGNTVKGYAKERCVIIFEKDMKQVRFYSANAQRAWGSTPVRVSDDAETFLGTGTPSYSEDAATTSVVQADPSNNKEQIFIADGEFLAGKCYWFAFSGSLQIFQICAVEADPKAEAPVFSGALSDEAICPGSSFATLDATASPVTSYAWYKDDEVIENAEAATYTPTEAGTYYCIATNSATGYRDNSTKSAEAVLSVNVTTAITTAPVNQRGAVDAEVTLSVAAEGAGLEYAWYTCSNEAGEDAVALGQTGTSINVTITENMSQWYKVVVTGDCGEEFATALVEEWHEVAQADVTESTTWDWTKSCWDGHENVVLANTGVEELMANVNNTVVNNSEFRSDMLVVRGQYAWRNESGKKYFQGYSVKFHTTVPGLVKVTYRGTGNSKNVILSIGDYTAPEYAGDYTTVQAFVPAGDVVINGIGGEGNENGMVRIKEIVFHAPDYTRNVSNNIGTLCVDHNVLVGGALGATFYQIASRNEQYNDKIDFEEVLPNEELKAGEPYIFRSNTGKIELFFGEETAATPVPVRGMIGSFANTTLDITEENKSDILYIAKNKLWNCEDLVGIGLEVVANRAYIVMSGVPTYADYVASQQSNGAAQRRRVTIGGDKVPEVATGMDNLNESETPVKVLINGQIFILRGEKMYDATGRLVK